jgi:GTPase Era involved in 16S rRNA processing
VFYVVDAVRRVEDDVRTSVARLQKLLERDVEPDHSEEEAELAGESVRSFSQRSQEHLPQIPAILVLNKVDLVKDRAKLKWKVDELTSLANFQDVLYISATSGYNFDQIK